MERNIVGIIISFAFIFILIGIATVLEKRNKLSKEGTRKLVHIGVSNWWIIAMIYFDNIWYAIILPSVFIIINYLSYRFQLINAMERKSGSNDLGTVYFPISLLILVIFTFGIIKIPYIGAVGTLIMGYGDGLAAIIGKKFGKRKYYVFNNEKSFEGTLTMFIASLLVCFSIFTIYSPNIILFKSLVIAVFATILEGFSPWGFDNLTVPIFSSLLYYILFF
ncbi:diacylglycerol/polyprenol kinase family protein [Alkaliphilus sp. B6464]|uniref:diacylglycerol/polyprenol kinase family protein n=1 Tax=Alkaliphilus sp. B6464 TaxID=2731219 RepID=UPI001BABC31D|nr:diacylglycerol/polyprenol kinase family protein [Alkaliphilus sp. B6464]QUH20309.1 phosphatidate cytidylyltransferase [Alkaliphilus sp. B6464]